MPVVKKDIPTKSAIRAELHDVRPVNTEAGTVAIIPIGIINVKMNFPTPL